MAPTKTSFQYGAHTVTLETGEVARQATGAVMVSMGETVVLVTVVGNRNESDRDFFPLTVDYQEKTYAAGKIPGGFFKREGRPSEKETLTSRLIDRPLRPLFPEGFRNEVQIVATVLSLDPKVDPDIPAMLGSSAALAVSGIPFNGPIGAARVGYRDGQYLLNPSFKDLEDSLLDLVVAGTDTSVLMVESEAKELAEEVMLGAVLFGHQHLQTAINAIRELAKAVGTQPWEWTPPAADGELLAAVDAYAAPIREGYTIVDKLLRRDTLARLRGEIATALLPAGQEPKWKPEHVRTAIENLEYKIVRAMALEEERRIDGRNRTQIRPITCRVGVLPRTHGSALFTRGETQALVVTSLGTERDAQIIDAIEGERSDRFLFHYNFPP
ncbi:MAG: polyribonucleotide nucleotidyltransferase, partial [Gammaproteobacteria bacterium]|nr:polyribonucleotide nucleotidyltransferase [Gammaproteobacteria bacterium]